MATDPISDYQRYLETLQRMLAIPATDLNTALTDAADVLAGALAADKVDAFLYDPARDSLVAAGASTQPLSALERQLGLDVLPLSNGGRAALAYKTGTVFRSGNVEDDEEELRGIREGLKIRSLVAAPFDVGGRRRGTIMVTSLEPNFFVELDTALVASAGKWVGSVAERAELTESIKRAAIEQSRHSTADELITVLAHDLRNYILPVVWRLHCLKQKAAADDRASDVADVEAAMGVLSRVSALVSNLLDVARLDSGLYALQLEPVDLGTLMSEAAAEMSSPQHPVIAKISQRVVVAADGTRLRQCVDNLLANATSHSPPSAPIHVFVNRENAERGAFGRVEIVDEGAGIPASVLPHIFEKFFSARAETGGLGLGLYIAERIASAHGGTLTADQDVGKGARFTLRIPAAA